MTPISVFSVVGERLRQGIARRRGRGRMAAAAALAASTAGPALAQSGDSVQIYGFIKEDVETIRLSGNGRTESLTRLANDLSVLGCAARNASAPIWRRSSRSRPICA